MAAPGEVPDEGMEVLVVIGAQSAAPRTIGAMSIAVELAELRAAIDDTDRAPFFLTVSDDGRPHSVAVAATWRDDELEVPVGNRTLANAAARPLVSLVWPARDPAGYTLIVDADVIATSGTGAGDNAVRVRPTRAVLHRPAAGPTDSACGSDCVPITLG